MKVTDDIHGSNVFVAELSWLCLKTIVALTNEYGMKVSDLGPIKKTSKWPLTTLSKQDLRKVSLLLTTNFPLKTAVSFKLDDQYWKRRILQDFPALHNRVRTSPSPSLRKDKKAGGTRATLSTPKTSQQFTKDNLIQLPPVISFVNRENDWFQSYFELLLSKAMQEDAWDSVQLILSIGASTIENLCCIIPIFRESEAKKKEIHVDVFEVLSQLPNLKNFSLNVKTSQSLQLNRNFCQNLILSLQLKNLTSFSFYESELDDNLAQDFLKGLCQASSLKELDLRHNYLSCQSMVLVNSIGLKVPLQKIRLDCNYIGLSGAQSLAELVEVSTTLTFLALDLNPIRDNGALVILKSVSVSRNLEVLTLSGCRISGENSFWQMMSEFVKQSDIMFLSLGSNLFKEGPPCDIMKDIERHGKTIVLISSISSPSKWTLRPLNGVKKPTSKSSFSLSSSVSLFDSEFKLETELLASCLYSKNWSG